MRIFSIQRAIPILWVWLTTMSVMAQGEDPWVGTWTSESIRMVNISATEKADGVIYSNYKYVIRITKRDGEYYVRKKSVNTDDPGNVVYDDDISVTYVNGNTMWIETQLSFTFDNTHRTITHQKKLTLHKGRMKYSWYNNHIVDRNRQTGSVKAEDEALDQSNKIFCVNLFNDDW